MSRFSTEKPYKIVDAVSKLLDQFSGNILPPISLAQLKVGNSFEKLKNEIRQLLYSLYR